MSAKISHGGARFFLQPLLRTNISGGLPHSYYRTTTGRDFRELASFIRRWAETTLLHRSRRRDRWRDFVSQMGQSFARVRYLGFRGTRNAKI